MLGLSILYYLQTNVLGLSIAQSLFSGVTLIHKGYFNMLTGDLLYSFAQSRNEVASIGV
jgi:hypothetical protein